MPKKPIRTALFAALLALASVSAYAQAVIVAPTAPPPPRVEVVPPARPGYVWDPGHWHWAHGNYVWVQGHWRPARVGYRWVPGHWVAHGANWRWVPAHWA